MKRSSWILLGALAAGQPPGERVQRPLPAAVEGAVSLDAMWGEPVVELQRTLDQLGYDTGPLDGVAGVRTSAALREFQSCNGLPPHGRLDRSTRSLLHLEEEEMFVGNQPPELVRERPGVVPRDAFGSDPLDLSSMPTASEGREPVADELVPVSGRDTDWMAAVTREECVERRKRPGKPRR